MRRQLGKIGYACTGSLVRHRMPCGRSGCQCAQGPQHWHGPYYDWSWKVKGKTKAVRLNPAQARILSGYVRNNRRLRRIVDQMRAISLKIVQAQLKAASTE